MSKTHEYNTNSVISNDSTVTGYWIMGSHPGVILIHGGANASAFYDFWEVNLRIIIQYIFLIIVEAV